MPARDQTRSGMPCPGHITGGQHTSEGAWLAQKCVSHNPGASSRTDISVQEATGEKMLADTGVTRVCRMLYTSPNGILACMLPPPLPYRPFPLNTQLPPALSAGHAGPSHLSWSPLESLDPPSMFRMSASLFQPRCHLLHRDSIRASTTGDHGKGSTMG